MTRSQKFAGSTHCISLYSLLIPNLIVQKILTLEFCCPHYTFPTRLNRRSFKFYPAWYSRYKASSLLLTLLYF